MPSVSSENSLLAALPAADLARLLPRLTSANFALREVVYRVGGKLSHVYFPLSGMLSAVVILSEGQLAESGEIGREGMVGMCAALGAERSAEQIFCQMAPCECLKMPVAEFQAEIEKAGALRRVVYQYIRSTLVVASQQTACNALHNIDARCARWLLMSHDAAGADEFPMTHEFLAIMLGVRRASVTVAARNLQRAGKISYRHGRIRILDRGSLEKSSCECYHVIRRSFAEV